MEIGVVISMVSTKKKRIIWKTISTRSGNQRLWKKVVDTNPPPETPEPDVREDLK